MKTIQDFKKQVLEERHGVHTYEDWDDFIDDATLTEILELTDMAWRRYTNNELLNRDEVKSLMKP